MSAISLSTSVNQHFLNKVMGLTDVMDVAASEDIVDMRGMKLVAKGTILTRSQQTTLGLHKLRKTLESTLVAEGAADARVIVAGATRLLDTSKPLQRILDNAGGGGPSPLALLGSMRFGAAMSMMLTLTDRNGPAALDHSIVVSLLSICMAKKLRLGADEQMVAGLAGLLHDIGELYIDPAYLAPGKRLLPHEWAHLVVHPRIGQMLINELETYPTSVARAVAEHHERIDATGYPRQLSGKDLSPAGQAVSAAEMIAGVLGKDNPLERAELALKIMPGEHAPALVSAISGALRAQARESTASATPDNAGDSVERLARHIAGARDAAQALAPRAERTPRTKALLERVVERINTIERAFASTGLDFFMKRDLVADAPDNDNGAILFEKAVATREIQWRLRDIARDLALNTLASHEEQALFAPLIALIDDNAANDPAAPASPGPASFEGRQPCAA